MTDKAAADKKKTDLEHRKQFWKKKYFRTLNKLRN